MSTKKIASVLLSLMIIAPLTATIIDVPGVQPTIQAGINAAVDGDTVLIAPDTYSENIHFHEKGIVVASHYIINNNPAYIESTIINGSMPNHPDTASCVLIVSDSAYTTADTTAALIGLTITGGAGTKWQDEHGAGLYREGGGILIQYLSPRIKHNIIKENHITDTQGVISTGGGGIRCGDGNPNIQNNVITANSALYGGGIVLNYTGATVKNNIIVLNSAGGAYGGGGGLWLLSNGTHPKTIENNTIAYNHPGGFASGGGLRLWLANVTVRNNIIWGNEAGQIYRTGGVVEVIYCDVQGGYAGEGNVDTDPFFEPQNFFLADSSPCVDAGDTSTIYNDPEDPLDPGYALWPSRGFLRNDMGTYGGPERTLLPDIPTGIEENPTEVSKYPVSLYNIPNPFTHKTEIRYSIRDTGYSIKDLTLRIYDISGRLVKSFDPISSIENQESSISWSGVDDANRKLSSGVYICRLQTGDHKQNSRMILLR
jgi:hypothetical protein